LGVELFDDAFGDFALREFNEREAAGPAGFPIDRHDDVGRLCDGREVGAQIRLRRAVRKVPNEQTDCQVCLLENADPA